VSPCSSLRKRRSAGSALLQLLLAAPLLPRPGGLLGLRLFDPVLLVSTAVVLSQDEHPPPVLLLVAAVMLSTSMVMPPHPMKLALQRGATCRTQACRVLAQHGVSLLLA
jgi:hypothetical protein